MSAWQDGERAPKDGTWVLVDLDDGKCECVPDDEVAECRSVHLARWNPKRFPNLGGTYEWEILRNGEFDHWSDGRVMDWRPLPAPSEAS